jgi:hypothetical protein
MKIQLRGHCQMCGREQAVRNGRVAKHGYTVANRGRFGWLRGTCSGHLFGPIETDRSMLDKCAAELREQAAKLRERAGLYESGAEPLPEGEYSPFPVARKLRDEASDAEWAAKKLVTAADELHGKPLREVVIN